MLVDTNPRERPVRRIARFRSSTPPAPSRVIVLANRAPFRHERDAQEQIVASRTAGGLVTALEPLVQAYSGVWVAHGAGTADPLVVDDRGGLNVPAGKPRYRLRYVQLDEDAHRGYYYGFSNEGLWPLCHTVAVEPVFRRADFHMYQAVNTQFADAVTEEAAGVSPIVFVHDYHVALVPRTLRQRLPASPVVAFWHIPWPRPSVFRMCPWGRELLDGLLGSSIVGFQTHDDCRNFLACVESTLSADVDACQSTVWYRGYSTSVRTYPVGVEWASQVASATPSSALCREYTCRELHLPSDVRLVVGIDRLDYTKGIREKLLAIESLLEQQPALRGRLVFVQVAEPSRDRIPAYRATRALIVAASHRINARFGTASYVPIRLFETHHEAADVYRLYRAADVCYVGSLHDGMNLVAKEFVCARDDEHGVLVLSQFAGAARQLHAALLVNPYDVDGAAAVLSAALRMPIDEQVTRMRLLRANVSTFDAAWWSRALLRDAIGDQFENSMPRTLFHAETQ